MQLVVLLDEIGAEGRSISQDLPVEYLGEVLQGDGRATGYGPLAPAGLEARLHRVSGGFELDGRFTAKLSGECSRCLAPVELSLPVEFRLHLVGVPRGKAAKEAATATSESVGSFELEDADEEMVADGRVDVLALVREQLILALPSTALCDDSCRGLCPHCGANLNDGACDCPTSEPDPRWAGLKGMKAR